MCETFSTEEAIRAFKLTLNNAKDLLLDAHTLLVAGCPHRAIALAVLAMQELGKLPRYFGVDRYERADRMKRWRQMFREHPTIVCPSGRRLIVCLVILRRRARRPSDADDAHKIGSSSAGPWRRTHHHDLCASVDEAAPEQLMSDSRRDVVVVVAPDGGGLYAEVKRQFLGGGVALAKSEHGNARAELRESLRGLARSRVDGDRRGW
jgi:hypothetical protein